MGEEDRLCGVISWDAAIEPLFVEDSAIEPLFVEVSAVELLSVLPSSLRQSISSPGPRNAHRALARLLFVE